MSVFPNPAREFINVNLKGIKLKEEDRLEIYDNQGRLMFFRKNIESKNLFFLDQLPQGVFWIKYVGDDHEEMVSRFIHFN